MKSTHAPFLEQVIATLRQHPDGLGLEALSAVLDGQPARRTLQRRLAEWIQQGHLVAAGTQRSRRYRLSPAQPSEARIPLSPEGQVIRDAIGQPLHLRGKGLGRHHQHVYGG